MSCGRYTRRFRRNNIVVLTLRVSTTVTRFQTQRSAMNFKAPAYSSFALGLTGETAFDVLAVAKKLKAGGKDVIELQIGDSPFPTTCSALAAGTKAIADGQTRYCPSMGLPEFREVIAETVRKEFNVPARAENVVVGPGAKVFEQFFCE